MRRSSAWVIGSVAAIAIGLILLLTSVTLTSGQDEIIMLPPITYQSFESPTFLSGNVTGSFSVFSGGLITASIFEGPEYESYVNTGYGVPLDSVYGNNDTFAASLDHIGRLFVVFANDNPNQSVHLKIHFEVRGLSLNVFFGAIGLFILGAGLDVLALMTRKKERNAPPREPPSAEQAADPLDNQRI